MNEKHIKNHLIWLKDQCWTEEGFINRKNIRTYEKAVRYYKENGFNISVHEYVIEQLEKKFEMQESLLLKH